MDFKDHWSLDAAMQILQNQTVDSKLWAEAVEWLLLYGPPEVINLLLQASGQATDNCFPDLKSIHDTPDGKPCYNIADMAQTLGISEQEAHDIIARKELLHSKHQFFEDGSVKTIH